MIKGYKGSLMSERKFKRWYYLTRVHEIITSKKEFLQIQNAIKIGETGKYIKESNLKFSQIIKRVPITVIPIIKIKTKRELISYRGMDLPRKCRGIN